MAGDIDEGMEGGRIQDCPERYMYRAIFSNFLKANMNFIRDTRAAEEEIPKNRAKLTEMMEMAPYGIKCSECFSKASRLFDKEVSPMSSLQVYRDSDGG